jgi:hypothetical protein
MYCLVLAKNQNWTQCRPKLKTLNPKAKLACWKVDTIGTGCTANGKISLSGFLLNFNIRYIPAKKQSWTKTRTKTGLVLTFESSGFHGMMGQLPVMSWEDKATVMSYKNHHARKASIHSNWVAR